MQLDRFAGGIAGLLAICLFLSTVQLFLLPAGVALAAPGETRP
jgi:hypothetical protein